MTRNAAFQYRFGRFAVEPRERRLLVDGEPVAAGPRAFDLLLMLIERAGQLVTKDELLERVWPKLVVEENNLQVQVSALRKILGQEAIATIPGQGYRFTPLPHPVAAQDGTPARKHNLPRPLTSFVGHEKDLAEYIQLLGQTRLLTLTGIGGCGKTRLAIELARMILPSFRDGAWFVDLAPIAEAERVATAVATTLEVREITERPMVETLARHLGGRQLLLVLDNCEHVLAGCAALVEHLLMAAPDVRALITSREGLGIAGERLVPVRSLALPPPGSTDDPATIATFEAVRLFADRAHLAASNFALDPSNAAAVAEICRRLDGIPLALELAAARVKLLSVEQIRAKLDDRFRLLTGNARAMSRHQTLLATLQWSYEHLASDEQQLLRQLSVFAGGWTLRGATAVAGQGADELWVLEHLGRLVDKSLVLVDGDARNEPRYRMLETVRQYAQDRLNESGESAAARTRHLQFYVALAEEAELELVGREQRAWFASLDPERENFLAAHAWCDRAENGAHLGLRLVSALRMYLRQRGLTALGYRITVEALARIGAEQSGLVRCRALWAAGEHSYFTGRYGEAKAYVEMSLTIAREMADEGMIGEALRLLGYLALQLGDRTAAREHFLAALAKARHSSNQLQLSSALNGLGELHRADGELEKAKPLYEEALALSSARGDREGVAVHLLNLAWATISLGQENEALAMMREGFAIIEEIGSKRVGLAYLDCSTVLAAAVGDWERAARFHGATEALMEAMGYRREPTDEVSLVPFLGRAREALSAEAFAAAEAQGRTVLFDDAIAAARAFVEAHSRRQAARKRSASRSR